MSTLLGIDLGTTALKVSLFGLDGALVASSSRSYPVLSPKPGYAEQDPGEWWNALAGCCDALRQTHPRQFAGVEGIGICGQMHTHVYLDGGGRLLRPAITWMDQRSSGLVQEITCSDEAHELIFRESQNFATTTYLAPQAL